MWGISSVGRALAWHARGHQFKSGILHHFYCVLFSGDRSAGVEPSLFFCPAALSNLPLQNLAFQGGDVVAAKTSIVEKTLIFVKQCGILKYLLVKRSNFGYLLPLLLTSL